MSQPYSDAEKTGIDQNDNCESDSAENFENNSESDERETEHPKSPLGFDMNGCLIGAVLFIATAVLIIFSIVSNTRGTVNQESFGFNSYHELVFTKNNIPSTYGDRYVFNGSSELNYYGTQFHVSFVENGKILSAVFSSSSTNVTIDKSAAKSVAMITMGQDKRRNVDLGDYVRDYPKSLEIILCPSDVDSFNNMTYVYENSKDGLRH